MERRNKPIIMTAIMGADDFAWANKLRKQHFPPERNLIDAHITLFHHLPPQALDEIKAAVASLTAGFAPPAAMITELMHLGKGVAYKIDSPDLLTMRMEMMDQFHGLLSDQDMQRPRLHITIQNKVTPKEAKDLLDNLLEEFEPKRLKIAGIGLQYYMDGPWETIGVWPFRGLQ